MFVCIGMAGHLQNKVVCHDGNVLISAVYAVIGFLFLPMRYLCGALLRSHCE